jgi:hypothetical protein
LEKHWGIARNNVSETKGCLIGSHLCRKYEDVCVERARRRAAFKRAFQERYGRRAKIHYPNTITNVPGFAKWLEHEVGAAANSVDKPSQEEIEESRLPEKMGTTYRAMYAHGMHLRIRSAEEEKVTYDSGVAAAVLRRSRGRAGARSGEVEKTEYVGWIEEIMELNYRNHCCIVLVCAWIPGQTTGLNPKVVRDRYGFTLGNFSQIMPLGPESFAFTTQMQQVF